MKNVKWIKLAVDVFDNRKIKLLEAMPNGDTLIVIWFKLLALAGETNDKGMVYFTKEVPYTDEMLATQFNRTLANVKLALATFQQFGMLDLVDDIFMISNWSKYQSSDRLEKLKEQNRTRQKKHYNTKKGIEVINGPKEVQNLTLGLTQPNAVDIEEEIDKDKEYLIHLSELESNSDDNGPIIEQNGPKVDLFGNENGPTEPKMDQKQQKKLEEQKINEEKEKLFEQFWKAYPRKEAKKKAKEWFMVKSRVIDKELIDKMLNTIEASKKALWKGKDFTFIPLPRTWLNQERYNDVIGIDLKSDKKDSLETFKQEMQQRLNLNSQK